MAFDHTSNDCCIDVCGLCEDSIIKNFIINIDSIKTLGLHWNWNGEEYFDLIVLFGVVGFRSHLAGSWL